MRHALLVKVNIIMMKSISNDNVSLGLFALSISAIIIYKNIIIILNNNKVDKQQHINKKVSCISAPGKVLIAGGYVVLEHPNLAITISTSSRFYTIIKSKQFTSNLLSLIKSSIASSSSSSSLHVTIVVDSPQFYTRYIYIYNPYDDKLINILTTSTDINNKLNNNNNNNNNNQAKSNPFIEKSILLTLSFIKKHYSEDGKDFLTFLQQTFMNSNTQYLYIKLQANNDFYSQTKLVR